ncbi:hypothetical protein F01_460467 [Burkholderia cenocepacia]|nr:hypothetical protein F01_460467 [Burkholderia cenocepacia]
MKGESNGNEKMMRTFFAGIAGLHLF